MTKARLRIAIAVMLVLLAAVFALAQIKDRELSPDTSLLLYGNVDLREVELAFMVQEQIEQMQAQEGEIVEPGQLLAIVRAERFEHAVQKLEAELAAQRQVLAALERGSRPQEIARAEAEWKAAQALLRDAELSYQRIRDLVAKKLAPPQDADDARAARDEKRERLKAAAQTLALIREGPREEEIQAARARVNAAQAALELARRDLQDSRLVAPQRGVIRARLLEPGDIASPQRPVYTLALTDPVWVRAYVDESDLGRIRPGMHASIRTDSFPDKVYAGWIGFISPTAEFTPKSVQTREVRSDLVYQVRVFACNPNNELRLGMPAEVHISLDQAAADRSRVHDEPCSAG